YERAVADRWGRIDHRNAVRFAGHHKRQWAGGALDRRWGHWADGDGELALGPSARVGGHARDNIDAQRQASARRWIASDQSAVVDHRHRVNGHCAVRAGLEDAVLGTEDLGWIALARHDSDEEFAGGHATLVRGPTKDGMSANGQTTPRRRCAIDERAVHDCRHGI